jgi:biopolymer transport protein ExbD
MVVTPQLTAYFWIHIPDKPEENAPPPPPSNQQPIVVSVTESGAIKINQEQVSDAEFPRKLRRVLAARHERKIFFDASNAAEYGRAVEVLDMARAGGAANIAVMTTAL